MVAIMFYVRTVRYCDRVIRSYESEYGVKICLAYISEHLGTFNWFSFQIVLKDVRINMNGSGSRDYFKENVVGKR